MGDDDRRRQQERARARARRLGIRPAGAGAPDPTPPVPATLRQFPQPAPSLAAGSLHVVGAPSPEAEHPKEERSPADARPAASPPARAQLLVTLVDSAPLIWRRLVVPHAITLAKLHRVLQVAMGWTDSHLHQFVAGDATYGDPELLVDDPPAANTRRTTLARVAPGAGTAIRYEYDFGDGWRHLIVVERLLRAEPGAQGVACLAGGGACPPEDCGGIGGYEDMLATLRCGRGQESRELLAWLGGPFDPAAFDVAAVNRALTRLR